LSEFLFFIVLLYQNTSTIAKELINVQDAIKNPPLTKKEIDEARKELHEALLPLSDPAKARPAEEVFAEVRAKYAKF